MAVIGAPRTAGVRAAQSRPPSAAERLRRFLRTPKGTMLWVLGGLAMIAAATTRGHAAELLAWAVGAAAAVDLAVVRVRRGRWAFPSGALLTGLFVAMVLSPIVPVYVPALVAAIAIALKHLVRTRWSNVFNPAALALVVGTVLLPSSQSWWGALPNLGVLGFALVLAGGWYMAAKINKLAAALSFLLTATLVFTVASFGGAAAHAVQIYRSPDTEMLLFFAAFMLTDPPTSPTRPRDQVWYGIVVGAAAAAIFLKFGVQWFLLGGLLLGNAVESARRLVSQRRRPAAATAARVRAVSQAHRR